LLAPIAVTDGIGQAEESQKDDTIKNPKETTEGEGKKAQKAAAKKAEEEREQGQDDAGEDSMDKVNFGMSVRDCMFEDSVGWWLKGVDQWEELVKNAKE
jgi:hypothetical protein